MQLKYSILFILIVSIACCTKKRYGAYTTGIGHSSYGYNLRKDGTFTYSYMSDTEFEKGSGDYKIIRDTIKFNFRRQPKLKRGSYKLKKMSPSKTEIEVDMMVVDSISQEGIMFYTAALFVDGKLLKGVDGDHEAKSKLKTIYSQRPIKIKVDYLRCYPIEIDIIEPGYYSAYIEMVGGKSEPTYPHEEFYRLVKWSQDSLILRYFDKNYTNNLFRY